MIRTAAHGATAPATACAAIRSHASDDGATVRAVTVTRRDRNRTAKPTDSDRADPIQTGVGGSSPRGWGSSPIGQSSPTKNPKTETENLNAKDSKTMTMNARILPNGNLLLTADNETRSDIKSSLQNPQRNYWSVMADLFEGYAGNGSFTHFDAGDGDPFVGLTSAPCVAETMHVHDDGSHEIEGRCWYFADYQIICDLDELKRKGRVEYALADAA